VTAFDSPPLSPVDPELEVEPDDELDEEPQPATSAARITNAEIAVTRRLVIPRVIS
jgi:hypothetical protein